MVAGGGIVRAGEVTVARTPGAALAIERGARHEVPLERGPKTITRVLMTTEGTYPFFVGGVSSVCHLLVSNTPEIQWDILPIVAGGRIRRPRFEAPENVRFLPAIDLWSRSVPRPELRRVDVLVELPARLLAGVMARDSDLTALVDALIWCRLIDEAGVHRAFSSPKGWELYLPELERLRDKPPLSMTKAAQLYQRLYWLARTAAVETPQADVVHVTAAGLASIPAVVDKALSGTPIVLTEHGIYTREAYLDGIRGNESPQSRWIATRFAAGVARLAYHSADVVSPVTEAHGHWETWLGADGDKIEPIYNGVEPSSDPQPPPRTKTVVIVGRIDPLKDVLTMLHVAAEVLRTVPEARFVHYGMAGEDQQDYLDACVALHGRLGLGSSYQFMGLTPSPRGAARDGDVVLLTSISEGVPMAILEGMAEARPVVATTVGGVSDLVRGCGLTAAPGDVHGLASAVRTLLTDPDLAERLGRRGYARLQRRFTEERFLSEHRRVFAETVNAS